MLCVDPDEASRAETVGTLGQLPDAECIEAGSIAAAEEAIGTDVDALVTEYELPDGTGLDLLETVRERAPDVACVLYTDVDRRAIDTSAFQGVIVEYVAKGAPGAAELLRTVIQSSVTFRTQTAYPLPEREPERLEALGRYDLDAEGLEAAAGRLTQLARWHFDVPVASINIITEHDQEFLMCSGDDWDSTDREDAVCTYTIVEESPVMVVEDLHADPRFEMITDSYDFEIRFYAGAKLTTEEGYTLGTFCIYDNEPRRLDAEGREFLRVLGEITMDVVELHRRSDDTTATPGTGVGQGGDA